MRWGILFYLSTDTRVLCLCVSLICKPISLFPNFIKIYIFNILLLLLLPQCVHFSPFALCVHCGQRCWRKRWRKFTEVTNVSCLCRWGTYYSIYWDLIYGEKIERKRKRQRERERERRGKRGKGERGRRGKERERRGGEREGGKHGRK